MSAGAIIQQFSNLVKHSESLGPKLSSNIRPSKDQLDEIRTLRMKLKEATASIDGHVEHLLQRASLRDKELDLLNRLRSSQLVEQLDSSLTSMLRRNLILIFRGPGVSALDNDKVRLRKEKTRARCEKLRMQNPALILRWSIAFQPSTWNVATVMTDHTIDLLIDEIEMEKLSQISSQVVDILQCLVQEEPLKSCDSFQQFVQQTITTMSTDEEPDEEPDAAAPPQVMTAEQQQQNVVPPKRKYMTPGESSHEVDTQEKIKLIKRSDGKQYQRQYMPK